MSYNKTQLWYISLTPEFIDHIKVKSLKYHRRFDLIYCFLEIALFAAKQEKRYCIKFSPEFSSIQQQLSVLLGFDQLTIEETFSAFVPLGWIICLKDCVKVEAAEALTTSKTYGSLQKAEKRGKNTLHNIEKRLADNQRTISGQMSTILSTIDNRMTDNKIIDSSRTDNSKLLSVDCSNFNYNSNTKNFKTDVAAALEEFGILPNKQKDILTKYSEKRVLDCIVAIQDRFDIRNPAGLLLTMLEKKWPVSKFTQKKTRKILNPNFCAQCSHSTSEENLLCNRNGEKFNYQSGEWEDCEYLARW